MLDPRARWVWLSTDYQPNEYVVFEDTFTYRAGEAILTLAAETDYLLFVNGERVSFGQFPGYPFVKYYDELDLTPYCRAGENHLSLTVRYEGVNSSTHIDDGAGVIFSLTANENTVLYSGTHTPARYDHRYLQHQSRLITGQLGLTSGMACGEHAACTPCVEVEKTYNLLPRPVDKTVLLPLVEGRPLAGTPHLYDLGQETAGYLTLTLTASSAATVTVTYGEHLLDGHVRHLIHNRNFSLDFQVAEGTHTFEQFFVRVACRYLQVIAPEGVTVERIGLLPALYPVTEIPFSLGGVDKRIYDTAVRTLRLCMNTHYEDCPWREQALYVLDSRNQMLCGYKAFRETTFPRENLKFMAKGVREDGLLELTYPAINTPAIPFFSLMFPVAVHEYTQHTGDPSVLQETFPVMQTILAVFRDRINKEGLISSFEAPYWNFYEWSPGSADGSKDTGNRDYTHLILNCAYVYACHYFERLCRRMNVVFESRTDEVKEAVRRNFFDEKTGLFSLRSDRPETCSQLGNAFALLIGLGDERTVQAVKHPEDTIPATLSMRSFVYDALL